MDNESINRDGMSQNSAEESTSEAFTEKAETVVDVSETVKTEKSGSESTFKPEAGTEETATYRMNKEAVPVQREYVNQTATGNPYQSANTYGQGIYTGNDYAAAGADTGKKKEKKAKKKGSGKFKRGLAFVGKAAAFGIVAGGIMFGINALGNKAINKKAKPLEVRTVTTADSGMKENNVENNVADVAEEVMPSIVSITNTSVQVVRSWFQSYEQEVQGAGSGIIIGQTDKEILVATNNHVIDGAKELTVSFSDETAVEATVKGVDKAMDLAVLAIDVDDMESDTLSKIKVAALGSSDDLRVGDNAIAIGNALGYGQSVTVGYISALDREVDADGKTMKLLQTDAAINPGNSGGALLNSKGEVIGINTMKYVDSKVEGMGYAIPISKAIPVINDLMEQKVIKESEQGYLGIQGNDITDEYAKNFNMPNGVYVTKILDDSPADKCGLKAGDIITKFGDREVSTMQELQSILSRKEAGEEVSMVVKRNNEKGEYKEITLTVTLGAKKDMPDNDKNSSKKDDKKKKDNKDEKSDDTEEDSDNTDGNYDEYQQDDGSGYQQIDPDDFFREFDEFFQR